MGSPGTAGLVFTYNARSERGQQWRYGTSGNTFVAVVAFRRPFHRDLRPERRFAVAALLDQDAIDLIQFSEVSFSRLRLLLELALFSSRLGNDQPWNGIEVVIVCGELVHRQLLHHGQCKRIVGQQAVLWREHRTAQ